MENLSKLSYPELATEILYNFCSDNLTKNGLNSLIKDAYNNFEYKEVVKIKKIGNINLLELYHGPTLAFKDIAMQVIGNMYDQLKVAENKSVNVVVATSGDTGSAAIDACKNYKRIKSFIMLPNGNMSEVQRRQMSTINASNVFALRINGTFDDCQDLVKLAFKKRDFLNPDQYLLAVNSINWTRIIGQICYYFYAFNQLHAKGNLNFSIPTGNFGNVFAVIQLIRWGYLLIKFLLLLIIMIFCIDSLVKMITQKNQFMTLSHPAWT